MADLNPDSVTAIHIGSVGLNTSVSDGILGEPTTVFAAQVSDIVLGGSQPPGAILLLPDTLVAMSIEGIALTSSTTLGAPESITAMAIGAITMGGVIAPDTLAAISIPDLGTLQGTIRDIASIEAMAIGPITIGGSIQAPDSVVAMAIGPITLEIPAFTLGAPDSITAISIPNPGPLGHGIRPGAIYAMSIGDITISRSPAC